MYRNRLWSVLRSPEGDDKGGGGNEPPKPLTEDDVGRIVNSAFTARLKQLNLEGKITEAIGGLKLDEKFSALTELISKAKPAGEDPGAGDNKKTVDPEVAKQLAKLSEQLELEKTARLNAEKARADAEEKHTFDAGRQQLYESLKTHADERLHDVWVDHLVHHGRLKIENGKPLLQVEYSPARGMPKQRDFLPLEDALPKLIESDESKRFMAAPTGGTGRASPGPKSAGTTQAKAGINSADPLDRVAARLESLGMNFDNEFSS